MSTVPNIITLGIVCADVIAHPVRSAPAKGELSFVDRVEVHLGGLAGATAIASSKLGASTGIIACVGQDSFGDFLVSTMADAGVDVSQVQRMADSTTSSTIVLVDGEGERSFLHSVGANACLREDCVDFDYVSQAKVLHWGGPALCPGLDGEPISRVMKRAQELGVCTSMDTVFDGSGRWYPLIEGVLPHLDIVMSSLEEARQYTGQDTPENMADFFLSKGPETVVIKLGPEGILLATPDTKLRISAHDVQVVDSTGAGDSACGGFLYGYVCGWDAERCARLANAVGALTVQSVGGAEADLSLERSLELMTGDA